MILYIAPGSPFARILRILSRERGGPLTEVETPLRDPTAPQLAHNPAGRVPALLDGATLICETPLILARLGWLPVEAAALSRLGQALAFMDGIAVWNRDLRRPEHERSPGFQALERVRANRETARLFDRLLTESCIEQTRQAVKYEGAAALQTGFQTLG